jgi:hypothetical protein
MDKIRVIRELQDADKSGITQSKKQLRSDLIAQVLEVSRKILAYAKMTENVPLAAEAYYPETELFKSTGNLLTNRASLIYDLVMKNQSALEPYDVTSELLTGFKKVIDQFSAVLPKPRLSIICLNHDLADLWISQIIFGIYQPFKFQALTSKVNQ